MSELDRLGWAVERTYSIGGAAFGIRCTSEAVGLELDRMLGRYRSDGSAPPRYSIVVADEPDGVVTKVRYHILYRGTIALIRTTDLRAVVRMLLIDLEPYLYPDRDDALYADMVPLSVDGRTVLVPEVLVPFIGTLGNRRVAKAGLRLPLDTSVAIDPEDGRLRPVHPMIEADLEAVSRLRQATPDGAADERPSLEEASGVDVLISISWGDVLIQPISKGLALYRLASHVANLLPLGERGLLGLKRLTEGAQCYEMASKKPPGMLETLLSTLRSEVSTGTA